MAHHISRPLLSEIIAHASSDPAREVCGLLLGSGSAIEGAVRTRNVHPDPARHFEIDPAALIAAHRAERAGGARLLGHYHSHPSGDPTPSQEDAASAEPGRVLLIVAGSEARLYRAEEGALRPLVLVATD